MRGKPHGACPTCVLRRGFLSKPPCKRKYVAGWAASSSVSQYTACQAPSIEAAAETELKRWEQHCVQTLAWYEDRMLLGQRQDCTGLGGT